MSSSSQSFEHASCNPLRWTLTSMGVFYLCLHLVLILLIGLHVLLSLISIRSPPQGPAPPKALPAPQRKKLVLRKPKRKTPQVVQEDEDEDDEATEDGLVTKRKRVAPSSPSALPIPTPPSPPAPTPPVQAIPLAAALPAVEGNEPNFMENPPSASTPFVSAGEGPPSTASIAEAAPGGDEGAHNSPIIITESPTSPPRQEAQPQQSIQEGGGESQH